ncbi:hypothetical protein D3C77_34310 [compost metagenome]
MVLIGVLNKLKEVLWSFRGALLVQVQSLGLWQGRQFRQYRAFSGTGITLQLRFQATKPFILSDQRLYIDDGIAQVRVLTGATPSGTWTNTATQQGKNRYSAEALAYVQGNFMQAGGTFTGGTERELFRADAGGGQGIAYSNIDANVRVLPAGDYYFEIVLTGQTAGIYSFEWEEL